MLLSILLRGHSDERDPENRTWRVEQDRFHARFQQTNDTISPVSVRDAFSRTDNGTRCLDALLHVQWMKQRHDVRENVSRRTHVMLSLSPRLPAPSQSVFRGLFSFQGSFHCLFSGLSLRYQCPTCTIGGDGYMQGPFPEHPFSYPFLRFVSVSTMLCKASSCSR